jgi:rhodanese-related sulfurtransferase
MRDPDALISTEALASVLSDPQVRVYDCTTYNNPPPPGVDEPYLPEPGLRTFREAHIPGADFLDLQGEFSDKSQRCWFMMPKDATEIEAAFARHGIGDGVRVVLYSVGTMMWATRFWWMLRALGFDNAAVLDGGFDKWKAEGRPIESGDPKGYPQAAFKARPRPGLFVDSHATRAAIGNPAGMTRLDKPEIMTGIQPIVMSVHFSPNAGTTAAGPSGDGNGVLRVGSFFYAHPLSKDWRLGFSVGSGFGLGVKYEDDWVGRYYVQESALITMSVAPSVAYRVNDWLSIGAGLNQEVRRRRSRAARQAPGWPACGRCGVWRWVGGRSAPASSTPSWRVC